jgi:hypothetical protein
MGNSIGPTFLTLMVLDLPPILPLGFAIMAFTGRILPSSEYTLILVGVLFGPSHTSNSTSIGLPSDSRNT